jgi:hypothetical protein
MSKKEKQPEWKGKVEELIREGGTFGNVRENLLKIGYSDIGASTYRRYRKQILGKNSNFENGIWELAKILGIYKPLNHLICKPQEFFIAMDLHHVNETDIVYIPTYVHRASAHKRGKSNLEGVIG